MSMPWEKKYSLMKHPVGSRAFELFLTSESLSLKLKTKLAKGVTGHFVDLALDKYGSHIVDRCWQVSDITFKVQ